MQKIKKLIIALTAMLMIVSVPLAAAQMTVRWEWLLDDPDVTAYRYQLDGEDPDGWTMVSGDTSSAEFSGLDADKAYTLYVQRSYDGVNWSPSASSTAAVEKAAPEEVPEEPIVKTYAYGGYELTAEILTGRAVLTYPAAVTDADAEAFIAYENAAYDLADAGVTYSLEGDGVAVFTYPETISREAAAAELDVLVADLIDYITPAPAEEPLPMPEEEVPEEPIVKTYTYGGYTLTAEVSEGSAVLSYPAFVTEAEASAFFATENSRYDLAGLGVTYMFTAPGEAVIGYPAAYTAEEAAAELDVLVADLIEYLTPAQAAEPETEPAVPAEEPAAEEVPAEETTEAAESPVAAEPAASAEEDESRFAFSLLIKGGVAADFDDSFKFGNIMANASLGFDFANILPAGDHFGFGLRSDLGVDFQPKGGAWDYADKMEYFTVANYAEAVSLDLKLTMDIVAGPMDLYLGGGAGIAAGNPLGDAVISGNLAQGEFTLGSADFAWDWFASAVAGVRFYMGDVFSLGAEVGYRYMVGAKQHIGSADIVLGFTF